MHSQIIHAKQHRSKKIKKQRARHVQQFYGMLANECAGSVASVG
jgi:hypothetical protein